MDSYPKPPKQRFPLGNGVKLIADDTIKVSDALRATCAQAVAALEQATAKGVYCVYVNEDRESPGEIHSLVIKFETK